MIGLRQAEKDIQETARRRLFCYFLARLGNPREAAVQAGYPAAKADEHAAALITDKRVLAMTMRYARLELEQDAWGQALHGLRRLAFGAVNDAVALVMNADSDEHDPDVASLDLFHVAEIKRPKGGGCEVKFYDRLAALQALVAQGGAGASKEGSLYQALEHSARALEDGREQSAL